MSTRYTNYKFNDARGDVRVQERKPVSWHIRHNELKEGRGLIRNISTTGMLLETDYLFHPNDQCMFYIDPSLGDNDYIPPSGRLVWHKRKKSLGEKYLCGIEFEFPPEDIGIRLRQRIQKEMHHSALIKKVGVLCDAAAVVAIVGLAWYMLWMASGIYENLKTSNAQMLSASSKQADLIRAQNQQITDLTDQLRQTNVLYQESEKALTNVSKELMATESILAETENMLTQVRAEKRELTLKVEQLSAQATSSGQEIRVLKEIQGEKVAQEKELLSIKDSLEGRVADLQAQNIKLKEEMTALDEQLRYYSGEVQTLEEGKEFLKMYKSRVKNVKAKIHAFKEQSEQAYRSALIDRDMLRLELGNNGYLMRNGETVDVDEQKYNKLTDDSIRESGKKVIQQVEAATQTQQTSEIISNATKKSKPRVDVDVMLSE